MQKTINISNEFINNLDKMEVDNDSINIDNILQRLDSIKKVKKDYHSIKETIKIFNSIKKQIQQGFINMELNSKYFINEKYSLSILLELDKKRIETGLLLKNMENECKEEIKKNSYQWKQYQKEILKSYPFENIEMITIYDTIKLKKDVKSN